MKQTTLENRLSISATIAVCAVLSLLIFDSLTTESSPALTSGQEEGVIAQVEDILALSAKHVFDEDYWIANMHSIRTTKF